MSDSQQQHVETRSLEFGALPLLEVALRIVPDSLIPVSLPLIIEIARKMPKGFGEVLDLGYAEIPIGKSTGAKYTTYNTAGCRFRNAEIGVTVALQPDLIVVSWARTEPSPYPRFPKLLEVALEFINLIRTVTAQQFQPSSAYLTYANRVDAEIIDGKVCPKPWPISERWTPKALQDDGSRLEIQASFRAKGDIDRSYRLHYRQDSPDSTGWYLLVSAASKQIESDSEPRALCNAVHDCLISWFPELLSDQAKRLYGMKQ